MEGEKVGLTADTPVAAALAAADVSHVQHDSDFSPVGSLDETLHEEDLHVLPSDEDHDHEEDADVEHEHEHDQDLQQSGPVDRTEVKRAKILKQVEYYFSDENLSTDKHLVGFIRKNKEGYVPITVIASFKKMKKITRDHSVIVAALKESSFLVVSSDGKRVKRLNPFAMVNFRDPKLCTVLVENLPEDHSKENIRRIFGEAGKIKQISIRDPHAMDELRRSNKGGVLLSSKLHALVEYDSVEAAEKAVAALDNEQDWRNGLRVKFLKQAVKHGQRKPWRDADAEKHSNGQASNHAVTSNHSVTSNHTVDAENHHPIKHNDDSPGEEEGDHALKEKNGHGGRNRGRQRRNKYRAANGHGHGSTCAHPVEPSKPPPGPKMPDGTRGFTMGRGRPLGPNQISQSI